MTVSTSNVCNLVCPSCPVGRREDKQPVQWMTVEKLNDILRKATTECRVPRVTFVGWCEPTLNEQLPFMVRMVHDYGIDCWVTTNLTVKFDVDALLAARPELIIVSDSGLKQETFAVDHPGGDVKAMKERLWHMAAHKHPKTKLLLLWHRYLYNEAEMPLMEELCRKAGVHFCPVEGKLLGIEAMMEAFAGVPTYDAVLGRLRTHITDIKEQCAKHRNAPCREQQRSLTLDAWGRLKVCGVAYSKGIIGDYLSMSMEEARDRWRDWVGRCYARTRDDTAPNHA